MRCMQLVASKPISLAEITPRRANSVRACRCRSRSTGRLYVRSNSRALPKARTASFGDPESSKMRASSSNRVGAKCGAAVLSIWASSWNLSHTFCFWDFATFFAHSMSATRLRACSALSGSVMIGQAGKPMARGRLRPTWRGWGWGSRPSRPMIKVSAARRVSGMSRTTGTPLIVAASATTGTISAGAAGLAVSSWEQGSTSGNIPPDATIRVGFMCFLLLMTVLRRIPRCGRHTRIRPCECPRTR